MTAWRGWYHVNGGTYGMWLPGDPRGWRDRGHRTHVEGDYKRPPPQGIGAELYDRSRGLLQQSPTRLSREQRPIVGTALLEMLDRQHVEAIALSVSDVHFHMLARFPSPKVKSFVGRAKKHAYFVLRDAGIADRIWEAGCHVLPIRDRQHQVNVFNYICAHQEKGAWLWTFRDRKE
jgi:REP element-mobilizing transposase RayT